MEEDYGFLPDPSLSVHRNSQRVLGGTPAGKYFVSPSNLAFHDLAQGRSLPPITMKILGLETKFVLVPLAATIKKKAMESCEETERSASWKVYFSGKENDQDFVKSKMHVKSKKIPPHPPP